MRYYRVHLASMTADDTPLPGYLVGFSRAELADLTWISPSFENGYLVGYAWWPEAIANRQPTMYERMEGEPTLRADAASKLVYATYEVVPWADEEIAQDKKYKHIDAMARAGRIIEQKGNEFSVTWGFDGMTPMMTAISYKDSSLPMEAAKGKAIFEWRDAARAITNPMVADVLQTGITLYEDPLYAALPPYPALPMLPPDAEPEDPPADPPVDPEPEPDEPETPPVDPEPLPTP